MILLYLLKIKFLTFNKIFTLMRHDKIDFAALGRTGICPRNWDTATHQHLDVQSLLCD